MQFNDETTAFQLHALLRARGYSISVRTVLRCRTLLGWTFRGSAHCQIVREENRRKRLEYAVKNKDYHFNDVLFTDECSVQLETHRRFCCHKLGEPPGTARNFNFSLRAKHPVKIHVWAGISLRGSTGICIFDGIMNAVLYTNILQATLLQFLRERFPDGHKFMQDNDPKHNSNHAKEFLIANNVNWWKTPLNPIENLWHELKEYLRSQPLRMHW